MVNFSSIFSFLLIFLTKNYKFTINLVQLFCQILLSNSWTFLKHQIFVTPFQRSSPQNLIGACLSWGSKFGGKYVCAWKLKIWSSQTLAVCLWQVSRTGILSSGNPRWRKHTSSFACRLRCNPALLTCPADMRKLNYRHCHPLSSSSSSLSSSLSSLSSLSSSSSTVKETQ